MSSQEIAIGFISLLTGTTIPVLFWQLVATLKERAKRAEDQVDTILPELRKLTETNRELVAALKAKQ